MKLYIKEWPDYTASLMTEHGQVVATFAGVEDAKIEALGNEEDLHSYCKHNNSRSFDKKTIIYID
jgi:hypothetical protein